MYLKDKNVLVAAIDHGFCTCKTPHVVFENGIQAFGVAPAFTEKTMRYKGNYYKVGEGRLPMKNVKTEDEDYFLLTLAGIAYEMDYYGLHYADVVVAAGLPFARFGAEKRAFTDYLKRGREDFEFNGKRYHINIVNVLLFPQCYAAVADRLGNMKADQLIVDIGSKTIDVIHTRNHVPVERDSFSLPEALISCTRRVEKAIYSQLNRKVKYNQKLAGIAMKENLSTAMYVVSEDEPIKKNYEMEVPTYFEAEKTEPATVDYDEYDFTVNRDVVINYPVAEPISGVTQIENAEQEVAASLDAGAYAKSESESDLDNAPVIDAGVEVEEEMSESVDGFGVVDSGYNDRKSESVIRSADDHDSRVRMPLTYSEYRFMTYSDKAKAFGVTEDMSVNDIVKVIRDFYDNCGQEYDFDGLMDEADMIFRVARRDAIHEVAENTAQVIEMLYESYENMPLEGKVGLFDFRMDDANYNLSLHREVLRLLGVKMDIEEMMDDYQKIYEEKMIRETEERNGKDKQIDRGRGR